MASPSSPSSSLASRPSPSSIARLPALAGAGRAGGLASASPSPSGADAAAEAGASVERRDDSAACVCGRELLPSDGGERRECGSWWCECG